MTSRLTTLIAQTPVLTDGAWGTELMARGLESGQCPDLWNLTRPDAVREVAESYVEAGSRVILTNTFRANSIALAAAGLADRLRELNHAGVVISKCAARNRARVFGSIGPTGKTLVSGEVTPAHVRGAFAEQAHALAAAGADALLIETMSDLEEARLALAASLESGLPVIVSFAFDSGRYQGRTMMGLAPERAAEAMRSEGADAVGANCGRGIGEFVPLCRRLASAGLPVWIKPNAGLPEFRDGKLLYSTTAEHFGSCVPALITAGATFIGGCCGTTPPFIREAAGALLCV